jgi:HEAT repeat protein
MIAELVVSGCTVGGVATLLLLDMRWRHHRVVAWKKVVEASGATVTSMHWRGRSRLTARLDTLAITIEMWVGKWRTWDPSGRFQGERPQVMVAVDGLPDGLGLSLEGSGLSKGPPEKEVQVGDLDFDEQVYIQGPTALVRALCDARFRHAVIGLLEISGVVDFGRLRALERTVPLPVLMPMLLDWARRLQWPDDPAAKLAANARSDPKDEVRLWNLLTLAREYPEDAATAPALRAALTDSYAEIRLRAAMMLGAEATEILLRMARDEKGDDECAARAVDALGERLGTDEVHALLNRALRARRLRTARACITQVGHRGGEHALPVLARILAIEKGDLAEAAALALGASRRGSAEAVLLAALHHEQGFVCKAAAEALGRVGSPAAVIPLKEMEAHTHPSEVEVRRAAREAVAAIRARTGGGAPGHL